MTSIIDCGKHLFANAFGIAMGMAFCIGSPATLFYLIIEDAQRRHSIACWIWLIAMDSTAAAIWPFYWLGRLIFNLF